MEQRIREAEIVSFDIFDTLVKRNIKCPEDVHELVRKKYFEQTGIDICEYRKLRVNAEKKARRYSGIEEISLEDILNALREVPDGEKGKLQEIEEETEIAVCCPDLRMKAIYEYALKEGKRVIITSDMYLDERIVKKILQKCGYDNFERLYLSSTYGVCKATGNLYEVIKKDYPSFQGKILHIGDNVKSDYAVPKSKGLEALLIDGQRNLLRYWSKDNKNVKDQLLYGSLFSFLNNHIEEESNDVVHIAYEVLGPMLLGYCVWLNERVKREGIEKIFFLSREGKVLQEAFNILYPYSKIKQTYLFVSRQALVVPLLADANDFDEMIKILKVFLHVPNLKTICVLCGLEQDKFNEELTHIDLDQETKIYEISGKKKAEVYCIIQKMGGYRFKQQKRYVLEYLKENDFNGNIAIVDIGWAGTMQIALQEYVKETDTVLRGYYFGVRNMEKSDYYNCIFRNGYLFEAGKNRDNNFDLMLRFTTEIFELLLLNKTGSVCKYSLEKNQIAPVLGEPEYIGDEGMFLESIQSKALHFLNSIRREMEFWGNLEVSAEIPMAPYSNFAVFPKMDTIKMFESFKFFTDGNVRKLLPEHTLCYYIFH
ncbi:MAG: hypothetical protein K2K90_15780, partial [Lachnospiraceae bacterium]|nr:hypothetical protein [Lachnospiraceae bacterium]